MLRTSSSLYPYGLVIPQGKAKALSSIRITNEEESEIQHKFYGGAGDKANLGGFTSFDSMGFAPTLWALVSLGGEGH